MNELCYRINKAALASSDALCEASREELRVLLALISADGEFESVSALAERCQLSPARCKSSLAFWEEWQIISENDGTPTITEEFESRIEKGEIREEESVQVAESIRDGSLAVTIDELADLMGEACLPSQEVKLITALYTQFALSPDYILTLAAHLKSRDRLNVRTLCREANKLISKDIDSVEALEAYLINLESATDAEWEFRRLFGLYGGSLSPVQKEYFRKWSKDFGYSVTIVTEAYNIASLNSKRGMDFRYIDKVLSSWHESGCRTLEECQNASRLLKQKRDEEKTETKRRSKTQPDKPRYGDFDIEDAFKNALARSYGEEEKED